MKRRAVLAGLAVLAVSGGAANAQSLTDRIVAQLRQQGYTQIQVSRTWLGRSRIVAQSPANRREIIVNPRTGEILRDYWEQGSDAPGGSIYDPEEVEDDDRGGEDRSGHGDDRDGGSGNSGSGSDNSGPGSDSSGSGSGGGDDD